MLLLDHGLLLGCWYRGCLCVSAEMAETGVAPPEDGAEGGCGEASDAGGSRR